MEDRGKAGLTETNVVWKKWHEGSHKELRFVVTTSFTHTDW